MNKHMFYYTRVEQINGPEEQISTKEYIDGSLRTHLLNYCIVYFLCNCMWQICFKWIVDAWYQNFICSLIHFIVFFAPLIFKFLCFASCLVLLIPLAIKFSFKWLSISWLSLLGSRSSFSRMVMGPANLSIIWALFLCSWFWLKGHTSDGTLAATIFIQVL